MILRRLELKHFGRFDKRCIEFRRGMNLILGPNESGKSTLMEAIPAILFGTRNKERFRAWGRQGACEAVLEFERNGRSVRVAREVLTDRVKVTEQDDLYQTLYSFEGKAAPQGRSAEHAEYQEKIVEWFGIAEEDVFRASLFFGQGSLEFSGSGLATRLKTLLSGFVEVDYDKVLHSLQEDHFAITRENPWGKDKTRERELDEIRRRLAELGERWYGGQETARKLQELRLEIAALQESIEHERTEHAKGERYLNWVRRQWQLEEKEEVLRRDYSRVNRQSEKVQDLVREKTALEKEQGKTGLPPQLPDGLPLLFTEAEEVRQALVGLQGEATALQQELSAHGNPPWRRWVLVTFLLLGGVAAPGWLRPAFLFPLAAGGGLLAIIVWGIYLRRALREQSERRRISALMQALENRREEVQARREVLAEKFERLGVPSSPVEIVRMQKNLDRHQKISARLREIESALQVLEKTEELAGEKDTLTRQLAVLDERMERERPLRGENILPPEELPEAEEKLAALGESIREREKKLLDLTRREAALQGELEFLPEIEEEGERLRHREIRLNRRRDALATAFDLLSGAVDEFRRTYLERFAAEIGQYLQMTTHGRYDSVRLDEDFSLYLRTRGGADWHPAEHFSRGTGDGVFLAARLALTRHLSQGRHLPLLLDDPLVNLDRHRLAETLRMLERLGNEHQVILFTHDESMARRGARDHWHMISLDESRNLHAPRGEERSQHAGQLHLL